MAVNDQRRIVQGRINKDKEITPESLNEALRQISTALHKLEGRSGQVNVRDNLSIKTDKATALEIDSGAGGKAAIVAFGTDNSGIALAKGSKRNEAGQWIATDTVSVIWAVSREGWASLYVNNNLRVGEAFEPIVVATIPGGTNPLLHNGLGGRSDADAHPAAAITNTAAGLIVSTNVQAAINELDSEKLARDGTQTMLGTLQMNSHSITNITDASFNGGVGNGVISGVRKIHMVGVEADGEARIDNIAALAFQQVTATPEDKRLAWDSTDKILEAFVQSGSTTPTHVNLGWDVVMAINKQPLKSGNLISMGHYHWTRDNLGGIGYLLPVGGITGNSNFLSDAILWLTGKSTGASILILQNSGTRVFQTNFLAGLTGMGHTYVESGTSGFNGNDPLTFDMVLFQGTTSETNTTIDNYLDANGSILCVQAASAPFARYGIAANASFQTSSGNLATITVPLGAGNPYTMTDAVDNQIAIGTKTRPGTTTFYTNNSGEYAVATWFQ